MRECPDLFPNDTSKARSLSGTNAFKNLISTSFNKGIFDDYIYIYIIYNDNPLNIYIPDLLTLYQHMAQKRSIHSLQDLDH